MTISAMSVVKKFETKSIDFENEVHVTLTINGTKIKVDAEQLRVSVSDSMRNKSGSRIWESLNFMCSPDYWEHLKVGSTFLFGSFISDFEFDDTEKYTTQWIIAGVNRAEDEDGNLLLGVSCSRYNNEE